MFGKSRMERLDVQVTYLQMFNVPTPPDPPREGVTVTRALSPTPSFYRYLYTAVGARWMWYERRKLNDAELKHIIHDSRLEVWVLYVDGVPAGYVEFDRCHPQEVEIAYFGLIGDFIGLGHGHYFVRWALHHAWRDGVRRVWLHTCSLDHPRALGVYQGAGLIAYKRETVRIVDPRELFADLG
ncbi:MAG: GNAT family N-acetyltransferase [Chromatiales bacterium]|jgi:hypothetical protein|nr:GNAT family N-acetyltransferase [Chromatiales bacterium]